MSYSYFERIRVTDRYTLYLKEKIKYNKAVKPEAYKEAQPATFEKDDSSFFVNDLWKGSEDLVQLPVRTKSFVELFPDQAKSLKNYIKSRKLKLDRQADLIRILDQYFKRR